MALAQGSSNTRNTQLLEPEKLEYQSKSKSSDVLHREYIQGLWMELSEEHFPTMCEAMRLNPSDTCTKHACISVTTSRDTRARNGRLDKLTVQPNKISFS